MPSPSVVDNLHRLVGSFNRSNLDVPSGLFDRGTVFRLNGTAYHDSLGRPPDDPLVRLIGCGPAAYRFNATALQRAFEAVRISLGPMETVGSSENGSQYWSGRGALRGRLRGTNEPFETTCVLTVTVDAHGCVKEFDMTMADEDVRTIKDARARE